MISAGTPAARRDLVESVRAALRGMADSETAEGLRAYMKSEMPCLGVRMPQHRKACGHLFREYPLHSFAAWRDTALALWREAEFREELYCAINLINAPQYGRFQNREALPIYREMIVTGAWWDLVDSIAPYRLGALLERYPRGMASTMRQWARGRDIWKRRAAIVSQLKRQEATDTGLLFDTIEASMDEREFFLRKAIGWALRTHADIDPDLVIDFVAKHRERLSPLSQREALRKVMDREALRRFIAGA